MQFHSVFSFQMENVVTCSSLIDWYFCNDIGPKRWVVLYNCTTGEKWKKIMRIGNLAIIRYWFENNIPYSNIDTTEEKRKKEKSRFFQGPTNQAVSRQLRNNTCKRFQDKLFIIVVVERKRNIWRWGDEKSRMGR